MTFGLQSLEDMAYVRSAIYSFKANEADCEF